MFDESKVPILLFIAAVIAVGSFAAHHFQTVDEANALLLESRHKLDSMSETITLRKLTLSNLEKAKAALDQEVSREAKLTKAQTDLEQRYRRIEGEIDSAVESMRTRVDKMRHEAPGSDLGDVSLTDGRILRAAKISKFDESSLTLIHADGVNTVTVNQLPSNITSKYDLGPQALLPRVLQIQSQFRGHTPISLKESPKEDRAAQTAALSARRIALEHQLETAAKHKDRMEKEVQDIDQQIKEAEDKGAYTLPLRTRRDVAEGNAGLARKEWRRLQVELETLKTEIQQLSAR